MERSEGDRERIVGDVQRELAARSEIVLALLHGSFLNAGAYRDIDVAIWLDPGRFSRDIRSRIAANAREMDSRDTRSSSSLARA